MAKLLLSTKRLQISKANTYMIVAIAAASFVVVFSLFASKALISQQGYQSRVIKEKDKALKQLTDNLAAVDSLEKQYMAFESSTTNVLGGNPKGTGEHDGDNARIVLDALPPRYDAPALASSLEKILNSGGYHVDALAVADQETTEGPNTESANPQPVAMPFQLAITGNYLDVQKIIQKLERSIRPIRIGTLDIDGENDKMRLSINAVTYYQTSKDIKITTKEVQ